MTKGARVAAAAGALLLLGLACQERTSRPSPAASAAPAAPSAPAPSSAPRPVVSAVPLDPAVARLHALAAAWLAASNRADGSGLEALYAPKLELYGAQLPREQAVEKKRAFRVKHPAAVERILPPIDVELRKDGQSVLRFVKRVTEGTEPPRDYRAYLRVREQEGRTWITAESDETTDRRMLYPTCEKLMEAILFDYVAHEKYNADMVFVEGGPEMPREDRAGDFAPKYEFNVGRYNENGPRMEHHASVLVDPKDGQIEVECPAHSGWDDSCGTHVDRPDEKHVKVPFQSELRSRIPEVCGAVLKKLGHAP